MKTRKLLFLLPMRLVFFAIFQALIAVVFIVLNNEQPWHKAEGWWIISGLMTNILTFLIVNQLFIREGKKYFDNLKPNPETWKRDLLTTVGLFIIGAPLAMLPNILLARLLFGSEEIATRLFLRPMPMWVITIGIIWAIGQGIVELQMYFGYIMPRLETKLKNNWQAWVITSFFLALQHITLPLIFNWHFILWRIGMFLLFAFFAGLCLELKPRIFPYFATAHALMDLSLLFLIPTV